MRGPVFFISNEILAITWFSETLRANGVVPPVFTLRFPGRLFSAAAPDSAAAPEVHQSPGPISLLGTIDEERNGQLPSRTENPSTSGAPHIVEESEIPSVPEPAANDSNPALATLTDSAPYPPMRLPTPEEEKPMITRMKTVEEDEIDSQIKQLQVGPMERQPLVARLTVFRHSCNWTKLRRENAILKRRTI